MNVQLQKGIVLRVVFVKGLGFPGIERMSNVGLFSEISHLCPARDCAYRAAENGKVDVLLRHAACLLTAVQHVPLGRCGVGRQGVRRDMPIVCENETNNTHLSVSHSQQQGARSDMMSQLTFS